MKVLVVTISDRAYRGVYNDLSGPAIEEIFAHALPDAQVRRTIVPDDAEPIRRAFESGLDCDVVISTGGTGLSRRDVTPEVTLAFCDRLIPGIAEALRAESLKQTPNAMLSRGVAGMKGHTIIINLPGSEKAARFCAELLAKVLSHAVKMIEGKGH